MHNRRSLAATAAVFAALFAAPLAAADNPRKLDVAEIDSCGPGCGVDRATVVAEGVEKRDFWVAGDTDVTGPAKLCWIAHLDADGDLIGGVTIVPNPMPGVMQTFECGGLVALEDGGVIVTGTGMNDWGTGGVGLVARFDASLSLLWETAVQAPFYAFHALGDVAVSGKGVVVAGTAMTPSVAVDLALTELDLSSGAVLGYVTYDAGADDNTGERMVVDSTGRFVVGGTLFSPGGDYAYLARFTPSLALDPSFDDDGILKVDFNTYVKLAGLDLASSDAVFVHAQADSDHGPPSSWRDYFALVRTDATLEPSFGFSGRASMQPSPTRSSVRCFLIDDHDFSCAGQRQSSPVEWSLVAWRAVDDGRLLDTSFGSGGLLDYQLLETDTTANNLVVDGDGALTTVGRYDASTCTFCGPTSQSLVVRVLPDGAVPPTFHR